MVDRPSDSRSPDSRTRNGNPPAPDPSPSPGPGIWNQPKPKVDPELARHAGLLGLWREAWDRRRERKERREQELLRLALVGDRPPNVQGALGLWAAFLTVEGVMAFLTGVVMYGLYAPAVRFGAEGIEVASRMSLAGIVVMILSVLYMACVGLGVMAFKASRRRRALRLRETADRAIAAAAAARTGYEFSTPEDEAEAELLHEHDRLSLASKPLKGRERKQG
jgi:hypothetical protein